MNLLYKIMPAFLVVLFSLHVSSAEDRFADNKDGTVTDKDTGLIWLKNADALGSLVWSDAVAKSSALSSDDFEWLSDGSRPGDWRLPDYHELKTLTAHSMAGGLLPEDNPFENHPGHRRGNAFWTASEGFYCADRAWSIHFWRGGGDNFVVKSETNHVWPVRGAIENIPPHAGKYELDADFAGLAEREQVRAELNALWDFGHIRKRTDFIVEHTEDFLKIPPEIEEWYPDRYIVAKHAPTIKLRIIPNIEPEYFPEGEAYSAGWANWGMITRSEENNFFMSAGDHRGRDCKLNIYEYRPREGEHGVLKRVVDVNELLGWHGDMYTDGKIHGHMGLMPNGDLWAATHHGPYPNEEWYQAGYRGSWLLSYNIHTGEAKNWGIPLVGNSLPYFWVDTKRGYFVGSGNLDATMLSWDINNKRVRFAGYPPNGWKWWRVTFLPDEETGLFWGMDESEEPYRFMSFDPELNRFERYELEVPRHPETGEQGRFNRFTTNRGEDGWFYCYAHNGTLFRFRPDGEDGPEAEAVCITPERRGPGSVHQLSFCPAGRYLYYVPRRPETMMIQQYDIRTGRHKTLGFLKDHILKKYGFSIGNGVYASKICADGSCLVILENGAFGRPGGFGGHPALIVFDIPEQERTLD